MPGIIMVVEDDPTLQMVTRLALEYLGYSCLSVGTGEEAVDQDLSDIILIFMDIGLPGIDGIKAASLIRAKELQLQRKHIPIIALTGHADVAKCLSAGMDDFHQKPALMVDLDRIIKKWFTPPS